MAVATHILADGGTFKTIAFTSITDFTFTESGTPIKISGDGQRSISMIGISEKQATVTVNGLDASTISAATNRVGQSGALVLKSRPLSAGDLNTATAKVYTFAEAVVTSVNPTVSNNGAATISITYEVYDSTDDSSLVAVT